MKDWEPLGAPMKRRLGVPGSPLGDPWKLPASSELIRSSGSPLELPGSHWEPLEAPGSPLGPLGAPWEPLRYPWKPTAR